MATFIGTAFDDSITPAGSSVGVTGPKATTTGADSVNGGGGNDTIDGGAGADTVQGGVGSDLILWNPNGGNDVIDGGDDVDRLVFTGTDAQETLTLAGAKAGHVALTRNLDKVNLDIDNVEVVQISALKGADTIALTNLVGTDVAKVVIDLSDGAGQPDGQVDTVTLAGSAGADTFRVSAAGSGYSVTQGLAGSTTALRVNVVGADLNDQVVLNGGDGADSFAVSGVGALTLNGGAGADLFSWAGGATAIDGGADVDSLSADVAGASGAGGASLSATNGQATLTTFADGTAVRITGVEQLALNGGATSDLFRVADLTGTGVQTVAIDLGLADEAKDFVNIAATAADDQVSLSGDVGGTITVSGLSAAVAVANAGANDVLRIEAGAGNDLVSAASLQTEVALVLDGGNGDDTLQGGAGFGILQGGDGSDNIAGGAGDELIAGGSGVDSLSGGGGDDTFQIVSGDSDLDIIFDFQAHDVNGSHDQIFLGGFGDQSFDDLIANGHLLGSDDKVIIVEEGHVVATLLHTSLASLDASDFLFG